MKNEKRKIVSIACVERSQSMIVAFAERSRSMSVVSLCPLPHAPCPMPSALPLYGFAA